MENKKPHRNQSVTLKKTISQIFWVLQHPVTFMNENIFSQVSCFPRWTPNVKKPVRLSAWSSSPVPVCIFLLFCNASIWFWNKLFWHHFGSRLRCDPFVLKTFHCFMTVQGQWIKFTSSRNGNDRGGGFIAQAVLLPIFSIFFVWAYFLHQALQNPICLKQSLMNSTQSHEDQDVYVMFQRIEIGHHCAGLHKCHVARMRGCNVITFPAACTESLALEMGRIIKTDSCPTGILIISIGHVLVLVFWDVFFQVANCTVPSACSSWAINKDSNLTNNSTFFRWDAPLGLIPVLPSNTNKGFSKHTQQTNDSEHSETFPFVSVSKRLNPWSVEEHKWTKHVSLGLNFCCKITWMKKDVLLLFHCKIFATRSKFAEVHKKNILTCDLYLSTGDSAKQPSHCFLVLPVWKVSFPDFKTCWSQP